MRQRGSSSAQGSRAGPSGPAAEEAVRGDVPAGPERCRMVDLPRAGAPVLRVVGDQSRRLRACLPQQGKPRGDGLLRVGVRLPPEIGGDRSRIGQVRLGFRHTRFDQQVVVVDEAGVGEAVDRPTQRESAANERQVEVRPTSESADPPCASPNTSVRRSNVRTLGVRPARQVAHGACQASPRRTASPAARAAPPPARCRSAAGRRRPARRRGRWQHRCHRPGTRSASRCADRAR